MQINVTGPHVEITSSLKNYASEKVGKLKKHFDHVTTTHIVLRVEKKRQLAEATVNATGATIHANAEGEDMYAAIDILADKLDRQIIKHKEKKTNHHRSHGADLKRTVAE